jgi:hypothetical protein
MINSGQDIKFSGQYYIFLGYVDYKRRRCMIADRHGNTCIVWNDQISYKKNKI